MPFFEVPITVSKVMHNNDNQIDQRRRPARSWITHSRHHTDRVHQLNVKLSGESNDILRSIASNENLRLYEVVEKALACYYQHHSIQDSTET